MVVRVAGEDQAFPYIVTGKLERPGPVGRPEPVLGIGLNVVAIQDESRGVGQLGQEVGLGGIDSNLKGFIIDHPHAGYRLGVPVDLFLDALDVSQVLVNHRGLGKWTGGAFDGPLEVVSGHPATVVKHGILAQVEGVYGPVRAFVPTLRQVRHNLQVLIYGHQTAEQLDDDLG